MSRKTSLPREVFLSHSSRDRTNANEIAEALRRHRIPVWYSQTNIVGAQQWHDEIGRALERCDWFLLLLSTHAVKSKWVKREIIYALNDERYDGRIVPLLLQPCNCQLLSWTLSGLQMVDFTRDFHAACRSLLRIWGIGYDPQ